jgi:hypothetical protein
MIKNLAIIGGDGMVILYGRKYLTKLIEIGTIRIGGYICRKP